MIEQILTSGIGIGGMVIALLVLNRAGVLDKLLKRNGNGKIDEKTKEATIKEIEENHFGQVNDRLGEISEKLDKLYECSKETNFLVKERLKK